MADNSAGFEELYTKPELIILIYKLLTFGDQLRLASSNRQLRAIFQSFIYPGNFNVMRTMKIPPNNFLVTNEADANCLVLPQQQLADFTYVYAEYVEEYSEDMSQLSHEHKPATRHPDVRVQQFGNLNCLQYVAVLIQDDHISLVAQQCPHLRQLHLIHCYSAIDGEPLQLGRGISIATLQKMKNLKSLTIQAEFSFQTMAFSLFHELITKLKLECFKTSAYLEPDSDGSVMPKDAVHHQLKELKIATSFDLQTWGGHSEGFLRHFENLVTLRVNLSGYISDAILATIAKTCQNLEVFSIEGRGDFRDITNFAMPPNVREFSLHNCYGLTHANLKQLLTAFKFQRFSSKYVLYEGKFTDFSISPCIQALDLGDVSTHKFPSAYVNNPNLKELKWHEKSDIDDFDDLTESGDVISINECPDPGPLETCINLEILNVYMGFVPVHRLLQLRHLKQLNISQDMPGLDWSYITDLLKHPTLTHLSLDCWIDSEMGCRLLRCRDIPTQAFATNVKLISLHMLVFKRALEFWMDLFAKNSEMKLVCHSFYIELDFIEKLVRHANFPKDVRTINMWGVNLKCKDLRENFHAAVTKLDAAIHILSLNCVYFERFGRLTLSRV